MNFLSSLSTSRLGILSELTLRIIFALLIFSHGEGKLSALMAEPETPLRVIENLAFFGDMPLFSSWLAAILETIIIPLLILAGGATFLGEKAKTLSTLGGLLATALMVNIILNFHVGVLEQTWTEFKYQLSLLAISVYFLFK